MELIYIEISSPFTYIYPDEGLKSMSYAVQIYNNQIYFGTSNGLFRHTWKSYYNPLNKNPYELVKNSKGQVWNLSVQQGDLFMNHHKGIFLIENNQANPIFTDNGAWMQLPLENNKLLGGYYDGLVLLEEKEPWEVTRNYYHNWRESCRIMVKDERGYIWVSHPYRGVFLK